MKPSYQIMYDFAKALSEKKEDDTATLLMEVFLDIRDLLAKEK